MQREELDTKLDNMRLEMRADASERRSEFDRFRVEMGAWKAGIEVALAAMNGRIDMLSAVMTARFDALTLRVDKLCESMSNMKYWIAGSAITTLMGVGAMVWTVQQSTLQAVGVGGTMQLHQQAVLDQINQQQQGFVLLQEAFRQEQQASRSHRQKTDETLIAIQNQIEKFRSSKKD